MIRFFVCALVGRVYENRDGARKEEVGVFDSRGRARGYTEICFCGFFFFF